MIKVNCLNPIAKIGLNQLGDNYELTDDFIDKIRFSNGCVK